ncbi:unnamed protein product [Paramecium sonneborni]|uniref:Uncharacterized protein n=1 Tax=Paramecium sonneborni TaxID=65129 RepID=A0A8S1PZC9_9CILI|nr:unnamed protein product [Paramecium sonneborni]
MATEQFEAVYDIIIQKQILIVKLIKIRENILLKYFDQILCLIILLMLKQLKQIQIDQQKFAFLVVQINTQKVLLMPLKLHQFQLFPPPKIFQKSQKIIFENYLDNKFELVLDQMTDRPLITQSQPNYDIGLIQEESEEEIIINIIQIQITYIFIVDILFFLKTKKQQDNDVYSKNYNDQIRQICQDIIYLIERFSFTLNGITFLTRFNFQRFCKTFFNKSDSLQGLKISCLFLFKDNYYSNEKPLFTPIQQVIPFYYNVYFLKYMNKLLLEISKFISTSIKHELENKEQKDQKYCFELLFLKIKLYLSIFMSRISYSLTKY